jgi:endonuclease/exonuclease/phosphatase (EEP) superfamily protein YafD
MQQNQPPVIEQKFKLRPAYLLLAVGDVYTVAVILYLIVHLLTGDFFWPVALLSAVIPWMLLPALAMLVILLAVRRWKRAILAAVPVLAFIWFYGTMFLPRLSPPPDCPPGSVDCRTIRVMAFNIASGYASEQRIADAIRTTDPDVIALNEVYDFQPEALGQDILDEYPYRVIYQGIITGKGLLSRYPIVEESGKFRIATVGTYLTATLDVESEPLHVMICHPPRPWFQRGFGYQYWPGTTEDFETIARIATDGSPTILLGDFNSTDQTPYYHIIASAGLTDVHREAGWGLGSTFPAYNSYWPFVPPMFRIDFIFVSDQFAVQRTWTGPDGGSDHLPLTADLVWTFDGTPQTGEAVMDD